MQADKKNQGNQRGEYNWDDDGETLLKYLWYSVAQAGCQLEATPLDQRPKFRGGLLQRWRQPVQFRALGATNKTLDISNAIKNAFLAESVLPQFQKQIVKKTKRSQTSSNQLERRFNQKNSWRRRNRQMIPAIRFGGIILGRRLILLRTVIKAYWDA